MLSIHIKTIPHSEQRCWGNIGDYWLENNGNDLEVRVSDLSDWRYEILVAIHELIEFFLCKYRGIDEGTIQAFDEEWYRKEELGVSHDVSEAGDDPNSPYHWQHAIATVVEKGLSHLLGVDWKDYCNRIEEVCVPSVTATESPWNGGEHAEDS